MCLFLFLVFYFLKQTLKMKDFKGKNIAVGDKVVYTDSYNRLLEGTVEDISGNQIRVSADMNRTGHSKVVKSAAVMKLETEQET